MATLVDSNVILDVVTDDQEWGDWSSAMLSQAAQGGRLLINPIIYAEVACRFPRIEDLDGILPAEYFTREPLPWAAGFLAGRAFLAYRRRGGTRPTPLPDFLILGAQKAGTTALYAYLRWHPEITGPSFKEVSFFDRHYARGEVVRFPIAHKDGSYFADETMLDRLEGEGRVAFRYCTADGGIAGSANPNGSRRNIAGIYNERWTVLGLMPHPERLADATLSGTDGAKMFLSLVETLH